MSRFSLLASVAACAAVSAVPAYAAAPAGAQADVVVTASRIAQPVEKTLAAVTVLDRADIERSQAQTLGDLLRRQAGVQYVNNGGRGSNASVFLRGSSSNHVLVLVDGVRVGSATLGTASLEHYNLSQIDRIEIVRGPRSSLYGSEAIGGVIQIFTRKAAAPLQVSVGAGSDQAQEHAVSLSGSSARSTHSLVLSYEEDQGFDSSTQDDALEGARYNYDDDAFRNQGANFNFSHLLSERVALDGSYINDEGKVEFDPGSYGPDGNPFSTFDNTVASLGASVDFAPLDVRMQVARAEDQTETAGSRSNFINTLRDTGLFQLGLNDDTLGTLVGGLEYVDENVESTEQYSVNERAVFSGFLQVQRNLGPVSLQLGGRHDDNEQFGSKKTGNVGVGLPIGDNVQVYSTYGSAFKAPTFNDLYWPADDYSAGNPDLKPETSHTGELGAKWFNQAHLLDVGFYKTEVKKLIEWQADENWFYSPTNVDDAELKGMDLAYGWHGDAWVIDTELALLKTRDLATGEKLIRRAEKTLSTSVDRQFEGFALGATWFVSGEREDRAYDEMGNPYRPRLGGYSTFDVRATYALNKEVELKTSLINVFDKNFVLAEGYNTAGFGAMFYVVYTPQ